MMVFDKNPVKNRAFKYFLVVTLAVGAAGSLFTETNIASWYAGLAHPDIAPPNWLFAPVWTTLYIAMAYAAWRVWRTTGLKSIEMLAFGVQLGLNLAWSAIFFGLHQISFALGEIILLDLAILYTIVLFWRRDRVAGLVMVPYLAWSVFASVLTHAFWKLNT